MRTLAVAALVALAWAAAPAAAVPATLFAHFGPPGQPFGLGTQEPDAAVALDDGQDPPATTLTCVPETPATDARDEHRLFGFVLGDAVVYGGEARPELPPRKGLLADLPLLGNPVLHWYWSAASADPAGAPLVVPQVVVRATLFVPDTIDPSMTEFGDGQVLASGESAPALLAGDASQGVEHDIVDGRPVYHFVVPMEAKPGTVLPRSGPPMLRVETYVRNDACQDGHVMPDAVRLHSSPGHRPRLELDTAEPLSLGLPLHATMEASVSKPVLHDVLLHAKVVDAWGSYDLARLEATVEGPGLGPTAMERAAVLQNVRLYDEGIVTFYVMSEQPFAAGNYSFRVSASTWQGANGTWEASFPLGEEPEAPGPAPGLMAAGLAAAAMASRRRS